MEREKANGVLGNGAVRAWSGMVGDGMLRATR
ncbi:hypothetical protein HDF10_003791 [Edaphobacter lichenicola]|uniref:Uncharacterized protein n=1 Tax=Tunturiibacter lichenicola TaxID=2051959 RepID=A0A7W8JAV0_9BACT|nr:hypothetical protein [Edaphobacter lichenicola]